MRTSAGALGAAAFVAILSSVTPASAGGPAPEVTSCKLIKTPAQLQAINTNATTLKGTYCLANDIDLSSIPSWTPIGGNLAGPYFTGQFYGNGHVIRNLNIVSSAAGFHGLFGVMTGGLIQDVGIVNAKVNVSAGGVQAGALIGVADQLATAPVVISNVYSTGTVACSGNACKVGGLIGGTQDATVLDAWSSAAVSSAGSAGAAGGLVGVMAGSGSYRRLYATGNVTGTDVSSAGGLAGSFAAGSGPATLEQAYATGTITGGSNALVGGLLGDVTGTNVISDVYATGAVNGGASATVGGLIGFLTEAKLDRAYSAGRVVGGSAHGGLIGNIQNGPTITRAYWDTDTSGQSTSAGMAPTAGKTTTQLRGGIPAGFSGAWGITKSLSYPYLNDPTNFTSGLATLVQANKVFTFLPIQQSDLGQYLGTPAHTDQASLATVYTMIGRAIGITDDVASLKDVKVNKYYWHDNTQITTFSGPITTHATLGAMKPIAAATPLNGTNVIGQMNAKRLVILRGTYAKTGGGTATHYMLGTLYVKSGNTVVSVVANDPYTGTQVEISLATKKVVTPGFPLATFKVDGYQPVSTID